MALWACRRDPSSEDPGDNGCTFTSRLSTREREDAPR